MTKFILRIYMAVIAFFIIGLFFLQMGIIKSQAGIEQIQENLQGRDLQHMIAHALEFNLTHVHIRPDPFSFILTKELCNGTLLNNTRLVRKEILFFNRVSKVGSTSMMTLLYYLAYRNQFRYYVNGKKRFEGVHLNYYEENRLTFMIDGLQPPALYARHVYFSNFSSQGLWNPIYCNMVRDPVERVISWYYYLRLPWVITNRSKDFPDLPLPRNDWLKKDYETCVLRGDTECTYTQTDHDSTSSNFEQSTMDGMISQVRFFCGHSEECGIFNGEWAMQEAKKNVEKSYAVVGVLENFNISLQVLEAYIPKFFRGVSDIYQERFDEIRNVNNNKLKPSVSEFVKNIVRKNFTREIEFYKFCQQRLWTQYVALQILKK